EEQADARLTEGGRMGRRRGCPTWRCLVPSTTLSDSHSGTGRVAEWFKAPVLKTGVPARVPWVRIPPLPPESLKSLMNSAYYTPTHNPMYNQFSLAAVQSSTLPSQRGSHRNAHERTRA